MTVEYVLLLICVFAISLKTFMSAPSDAFKKSGPRLAARVEKSISTGNGFEDSNGKIQWQGK